VVRKKKTSIMKTTQVMKAQMKQKKRIMITLMRCLKMFQVMKGTKTTLSVKILS